MKTLHLTLKKKWFDMILSGEKTEEYREIKPHWIKRFLKPNFFPGTMEADQFSWDDFCSDLMKYEKTGWQSHHQLLEHFNFSCREFTHVKFVNGYGADRPFCLVEVEWIGFGCGRKEWGGFEGERCFCISLGQIVNKGNLPTHEPCSLKHN